MKIAVLLSGGVDSSVALRLLKEQGHEITAFYLKIWLQDDFSFLGNCPWEEDLEFARSVSNQAEVPLEVLPLQDEYWASVVSYTIKEIKEGRTPNPDMYCNCIIKFGEFLNKIDSSFEKVASGHYARIEEQAGSVILRTSPDPVKDQTYFLAYLKPGQLKRTTFPLGQFNKRQIRQLAADYALPNMSRKDSQGICFLGKIKFKDFIKQHLGEVPGDIVELETGIKRGRHPGYYYYTIGQRQGLGLGGGPWYVVRKDVINNIIYVSLKQDLLHQERNSFSVLNYNMITPFPEIDTLRVKIRHGVNYYGCTIDNTDVQNIHVTLAQNDIGIASGQFAVFYHDDLCLGGGVISVNNEY